MPNLSPIFHGYRRCKCSPIRSERKRKRFLCGARPRGWNGPKQADYPGMWERPYAPSEPPVRSAWIRETTRSGAILVTAPVRRSFSSTVP